MLLVFFGSLAIGLGFVGYQTNEWLKVQDQEMKLRAQRTTALINQSKQAAKQFDEKIKTLNTAPWKPLGEEHIPPPSSPLVDDNSPKKDTSPLLFLFFGFFILGLGFSIQQVYVEQKTQDQQSKQGSKSFYTPSYGTGTIRVRSYTRRDGTRVRSYTRRRRR